VFTENKFSGIDGAGHELDDRLFGNAFQDVLSFAFFSQRRKLEPPGERFDVYTARRISCPSDNGLPETVFETLLVFLDSIIEEPQQRDEDELSTVTDLA